MIYEDCVAGVQEFRRHGRSLKELLPAIHTSGIAAGREMPGISGIVRGRNAGSVAVRHDYRVCLVPTVASTCPNRRLLSAPQAADNSETVQQETRSQTCFALMPASYSTLHYKVKTLFLIEEAGAVYTLAFEDYR